jgi:Holliday junction resolvasome RuvABC endonuclease subunit
MRLLAFDASSTRIGWCLWDGSNAEAHGTIILTGGLLQRICLAETVVGALLDKHAPDAIALEAPAFSRTSELVSQQRVAGVLLLVVTRRQYLSIEIAPSQAKKVLTGDGRAKKPAMIAAARLHMPTCDEHAADALGVAMAAHPKFVMGVGV